MHDTLAAMYTLIYNISCVFAPLFGGWMYDNYGYETSLEMAFGSMLIISTIYFLFNCGFDVFEEHKRELKNLEELKKES